MRNLDYKIQKLENEIQEFHCIFVPILGLVHVSMLRHSEVKLNDKKFSVVKMIHSTTVAQFQEL